MCVDPSRNPSPVNSTASSWIDLGSHGTRSGCSGDEDSAGLRSVHDNIVAVALLKAQLEVLSSTTPTLSVFNAIVEFVKETLSPEVHVSMDSSEKKGGATMLSCMTPHRSLCLNEGWQVLDRTS